MKHCQICGHQSEPDGQLQCECLNKPIESYHIVDANKKVPWADELTPTIDVSDMYYPDTAIEVGRNLERRMRAAERLLHRFAKYIPGTALEFADLIDHLEAALKDDVR